MQKVSFDKDNLVANALLLESFRHSPVQQYKEGSRELEISILDRISEPADFDLIFQRMLEDAADGDDIAQMLAIGSNLNRGLLHIYNWALMNLPSTTPPPDYKAFLKNPAVAFGPEESALTEAQKTKLNQAYILIYELDTFSEGMDCVWSKPSKDKGCPHLQTPVEGTSEVQLLNHHIQLRKGAPLFPWQPSCAVEHSAVDGEYTCASGGAAPVESSHS